MPPTHSEKITNPRSRIIFENGCGCADSFSDPIFNPVIMPCIKRSFMANWCQRTANTCMMTVINTILLRIGWARPARSTASADKNGASGPEKNMSSYDAMPVRAVNPIKVISRYTATPPIAECPAVSSVSFFSTRLRLATAVFGAGGGKLENRA